MANENKMTKAKRFADVRAFLCDEERPYGSTVDELVAFIDKETEQLAKKNASRSDGKETETQKKNAEYKALIMDFMSTREDTSKGMTCTAIGQSIPVLVAEGYGTSKFSSLCNGLVTDGKLIKKQEKGKVLFYLA